MITSESPIILLLQLRSLPLLKVWQGSSPALVIHMARLSHNERNLSASTLPMPIKKWMVRLRIISLVTILSVQVAFTRIHGADPDPESMGPLPYVADPAFRESTWMSAIDRPITYSHEHVHQQSALDPMNTKRKHHKERSKKVCDNSKERQKLQHHCHRRASSHLKDTTLVANTVISRTTQWIGQSQENPIFVPDNQGYTSEDSILGSRITDYATNSVKQTEQPESGTSRPLSLSPKIPQHTPHDSENQFSMR